MRRPRGPGGRFLTADEVAEMENKKKHDGQGENGGNNGNSNGQGSMPPTKGKEPQQKMGHNQDLSTPIKGSAPTANMGMISNNGNGGITASGGSAKRKASSMSGNNESPLKKSKGNGNMKLVAARRFPTTNRMEDPSEEGSEGLEDN